MSDIDKPTAIVKDETMDASGSNANGGSSSGLSAANVNVALTVRMIMNGKEVGSIIGKGGEIINNIREESGAKIHITDGSVPERIVTVTGATDSILKAFSMICKKLEDDAASAPDRRDGASSSASNGPHKGPVLIRLIVPASQCGSLIGKGGSKIKEIRESSGASIQVASDMLPNSTERSVTIGGTKDSISSCIFNICVVMLESPPKGTAIPYTPKANGAGIGGLGGPMSHPQHGGRMQNLGGRHGHPSAGGLGGLGGGLDMNLAGLLGLGGGASTLAALVDVARSQIGDSDSRGGHHGGRNSHSGGRDRSRDQDNNRGSGERSETYEMSIPNDLIGCIIGKGGSKIAEIRQISGAMIRISKSEDPRGDSGKSESSESSASERQITITGSKDSVTLAKSLINMSLDIHKSKMEERGSNSGGGNSGNSRDDGGNNSGNFQARERRNDRSSFERGNGGASSAALASQVSALNNPLGGAANLGLAALLAKPEAINALTTLAGLHNLGAAGLLGGLGAAQAQPTHHSGVSGLVTGVHRSRTSYGGNSRSGGSGSGGARNSGSSSNDDERRESKRVTSSTTFNKSKVPNVADVVNGELPEVVSSTTPTVNVKAVTASAVTAAGNVVPVVTVDPSKSIA